MAETAGLVILAAVLLDLAAGDPPTAWHPVGWMGRFLNGGWRVRPRSYPVLQFLFGMAWVLIGLTLFALPWVFLSRLSVPLEWLWSAPLLKATFAIRSLLRAGEEVQAALERGDLPKARQLVRWHLVGRETTNLPEPLVVSATVESLAENVTDSLTGPLFWFALGGLPGAWAYRFVNTADSMWGHHDPEREYVGKFAARLDDLLNWIPARLTALLLAVAAILAGENAAGAWRQAVAQYRRTLSPNAGWTMAAMAGALGVTLEKVGQYRLEGGNGPLDVRTLRRALRVVRWCCALVVGVLLLLAVGWRSCV